MFKNKRLSIRASLQPPVFVLDPGYDTDQAADDQAFFVCHA